MCDWNFQFHLNKFLQFIKSLKLTTLLVIILSNGTANIRDFYRSLIKDFLLVGTHTTCKMGKSFKSNKPIRIRFGSSTQSLFGNAKRIKNVYQRSLEIRWMIFFWKKKISSKEQSRQIYFSLIQKTDRPWKKRRKKPFPLLLKLSKLCATNVCDIW